MVRKITNAAFIERSKPAQALGVASRFLSRPFLFLGEEAVQPLSGYILSSSKRIKKRRREGGVWNGKL